MPFILHCVCGRKLRAPQKHAGKRVRCPNCGAAVRVPTVLPSEPVWLTAEDEYDEAEAAPSPSPLEDLLPPKDAFPPDGPIAEASEDSATSDLVDREPIVGDIDDSASGLGGWGGKLPVGKLLLAALAVAAVAGLVAGVMTLTRRTGSAPAATPAAAVPGSAAPGASGPGSVGGYFEALAAARKKAGGALVANHLQQLGLALAAYHQSYANAWPDTLDQLKGVMPEVDALLANPRTKQAVGFVYEKPGNTVQDVADPAHTPVVWELDAQGHKDPHGAILHADGHVEQGE